MKNDFNDLLSMVIAIIIVNCLNGTILYFIWPMVMNVFPGLVRWGVFENISWVQAICIVWVFSILFKNIIIKD